MYNKAGSQYAAKCTHTYVRTYVRMYLKKTCAWNATYTHCTYVRMHLFHFLLHIMLQDLMVDENIHKLEVRRLRETLFARADDVLSLEKRKLHLHTVSNSNGVKIVHGGGKEYCGSIRIILCLYVCMCTYFTIAYIVCTYIRYRILCMCT